MGWNIDPSGIVNAVMKTLEPQLQIVKHICKNVIGVYEVLSREYGVPPAGDDARFAPRGQSKTPLVIEKTIPMGATEEFDLLALNQGRFPSRGFYRNIGNDPLKVILTGADGQPTAQHTLLSKDTIAITNYTSKIAVSAGTTPVTVQILAQ